MSQPDAPAVPGPKPDAPPAAGNKASSLQKLWVPVTVLVGFVLGEVISYYSTEPEPTCRGGFACGPFGFNQFPHFDNEPSIQFHIILTTISIALLIALVVVYVRMYSQTKANFS